MVARGQGMAMQGWRSNRQGAQRRKVRAAVGSSEIQSTIKEWEVWPEPIAP